MCLNPRNHVLGTEPDFQNAALLSRAFGIGVADILYILFITPASVMACCGKPVSTGAV